MSFLESSGLLYSLNLYLREGLLGFLLLGLLSKNKVSHIPVLLPRLCSYGWDYYPSPKQLKHNLVSNMHHTKFFSKNCPWLALITKKRTYAWMVCKTAIQVSEIAPASNQLLESFNRKAFKVFVLRNNIGNSFSTLYDMKF